MLSVALMFLVVACGEPEPAASPGDEPDEPAEDADEPEEPEEPVDAEEPVEVPSSMVAVAPGTTSVGYVAGNAMLSAITEQTGVDFRVVPFERVPELAFGLKNGVGEFGFWYTAIAHEGLTGTGTYEELGLEPQSLRTLFNGGDLSQGLVTRGDAGIETMADLAGKRLVSYVGDPTLDRYYMDAALAYADLTWDDVEVVEVGGYGEALSAVLSGAADVAFSSTTGDQMYELEASVHGIHWIPMPASDTEAWARFHDVNPSFFPLPATIGAGLSEEEPVELWAYNYQLVGYDWLEHDTAYWLTQQVVEQYDHYRDTHAFLERWTVDHALLEDTWFMPWHEGSVQYFQDTDRWTDEMEQKQQELLEVYPQTMTE